MGEPSVLHDYQHAFAAHLRNPRKAPPKGVAREGMAVYRELVFNNLCGFLDACYPVTARLLGKRRWQSLIRRYFAEHPGQSPLFRDIPGEFAAWLAEERAPEPADPPFLAELAHYEWVELDLSQAVDPEPQAIDEAGDLLAGRPLPAPVHAILGYRFPVHRIGPRYRPTEAPEVATWLFVFRDGEDRIRFLEINALTAALLERLKDAPLSGAEALRRLAEEAGMEASPAFMAAGEGILRKLREEGALIGAGPIAGPSRIPSKPAA